MTENYPTRFSESEQLHHKNKAAAEKYVRKMQIIGNDRPLPSPEIIEFYTEHPDAPGCPPELRQELQNASGELPFEVFASTLLDPQETTSSFAVKGTYRAQFMDGKENEYFATIEAFRKMCNKNAGSRIFALDNCRRYAHFARDAVSGDVRVMTDSCRQRWCPMCAGSKSKYAKESVRSWIESLESPRFLTLTLRHQEGELLPQIQFLQDCFRRLRQRAFWKKNVTGGIWFMQVHRSKNDGCWHPHLHILLDGNYLEHGQLSDLWDLVTYGSPVLYIVPIDNPEESAKYVARYTARPAQLENMELDDRIELIESLHGKRLSGTFGSAKCVTLTPPKIESDTDWETIGYFDKVVSDSATNKAAQAIVQAWKMDKPLPDWAFKSYTEMNKPAYVPVVERKKVIQLTLDFYNSS